MVRNRRDNRKPGTVLIIALFYLVQKIEAVQRMMAESGFDVTLTEEASERIKSNSNVTEYGHCSVEVSDLDLSSNSRMNFRKVRVFLLTISLKCF